MPSIRRLLAVAAAVAIGAAPLAAQSDEETVARYRLTEAALTKFIQVSRNMVAAAKADPSLFSEEDDDSDASTIAEMAAMYDKRPALKQAIVSAGLSPREYVIFMLSMAQAGVAAWAVKQQQGKFDGIPAGIPRENAVFYQRHEAELTRMGEEMRALMGVKAAEPPDLR